MPAPRVVTACSLAVIAIALAAITACTVQQAASAPPLAGPSGRAQTLTVTVTPDRLTQDGLSQAAVSVLVIDASGRPASNVPVRLDMFVNGVLVDFGTLSTKNVVTGSDGRASTVYTAPAAPPPSANSGTNTVAIRATALGGDAVDSPGFTANISLVPPGVILPPAGTPTAKFTFSPSAPTAGAVVNFDASSSIPGSGATAITSYTWSFGDGSTSSGVTTTHTFSVANTFSVTLTVTSDRGLSASVTQNVAVTAADPLSAAFTVSPLSPVVGDTVIFDASASATAPGQSIVGWAWNFGDDTPIVQGGSRIQSHVYLKPGTFTVNLVLTDSLGRTVSATNTVTVK